MKEKKGRRFVPWPWSLILYILFVVGAGYFIGYLWSFLIALGISAWRRKQNPDMPEGGYCLDKTRKRLASLGIAIILLFLGVCLCIYGWLLIQSDMTEWEARQYLELAVGLIGGLGFLASGIGTAYIALRDTFCPEKSTLARSIRSQLPYPDAAPGVRELFAMVDQDIRENGIWFDKVAVGKEWVLGEVASYIPRIRVFFGRDEFRTHRSGDRVNTNRIIELYILDDRRQTQIMTLRDPKELQSLMDCIALRAPDALVRPYKEYATWRSKSDMEWENMLREYRVKQGERELSSFRLGNSDANVTQNMILTAPDGSVTSRVTPELIHQMMIKCLKEGEGTFSLAPGCPIEQHGVRYVEMECFVTFYEDIEDPSLEEMEDLGEAELLLKMTATGEGGKNLYSGRVYHTDIQTAEGILRKWIQGELVSMKDWEATPLWEQGNREQPKREVYPPHLSLMSVSGVYQSHDRFTLEDIQVAAEGLVDGTYQSVDLTLKGGYLWMRIQAGNKTDGRCSVSVTRADSDKLRFFKNLCTHRQAAAWLLEFAKGNFRPDWKEWTDYTRQAEKEMNRKT